MPGPFDDRGARPWDEASVFGAAIDRHDGIEIALAGDDERRGGDTPAVVNEIERRDEPGALGHS